MSNDLIYAIDTMVTGIGSLGIGNVKDESYVRIVVTNADGPNEFLVRARILDGGWNNLVTISGSDEVLVNVFTYDELEIICQVYDSSTNNVKLVATSYNQPDNIIPPGGTTGQTLIKSSNNDFDLEWAAASSVGSFTDLTDVPSSYVSHANEIVAVNATEDDLNLLIYQVEESLLLMERVEYLNLLQQELLAPTLESALLQIHTHLTYQQHLPLIQVNYLVQTGVLLMIN